MADYTFIQNGDPDAAANVGVAIGLWDVGGWLVEGLTLSNLDTAGDTVDIAQGKTAHFLDTATATWEDANSNVFNETRHEVLVVAHLDARTGVALTDGSINHIFVEPNYGTTDSPTIEVNTTNALPSSDAIKIAEVDEPSGTFTHQWRKSVPGGLTFPDESSIDSEDGQGRLPEGTQVYDRATNTGYLITA